MTDVQEHNGGGDDDGSDTNSLITDEDIASVVQTLGDGNDAGASYGLEKLGIDPAYEEVIELADTSILHTPGGRFRVERICDNQELRPRPLHIPRLERLPPPPPPPPEKPWPFEPSSPSTISSLPREPARPCRDSSLLPEVDHSQGPPPFSDDKKDGDGSRVGHDRTRGRHDDLVSPLSPLPDASPPMPPSQGGAPRMEWASSEASSGSGGYYYVPVPSLKPSGHFVQPDPYRNPSHVNSSVSDVRRAPTGSGLVEASPASPTSSPPAYVSAAQMELIDTNAAIVVSRDSVGSVQHEDERPGEVLVVQTNVSAAPSVRGPFHPGYVKVFRNTLTGDLRLVTITAYGMTREVDKHLVRAKEVELVPMYAYDYRANVLYLQAAEAHNSRRLSAPTTPGGPSGMVYKFELTKDMLDFQGKLLEEDVCFDISNVRSLVLAVAGGNTREIYSPRVQLWHQRRSQSRNRDDSSFITSGTKLTASDPDRTELLYSRLVIYLGRSQEFITLFVTDDVSYKKKSESTLVFSATKYSGLEVWKSRRSLKCGLVKGSDRGPAGIRLDKRGLSLADEDSFSQYKTFDLTFEDERDRSSFLETWEQMIRARRNARERIRRVQQAMAQKMYTGSVAAKIIG